VNEEQADEIIAKLDHLAINAMTREQGQEIIKLLKEIATELSELHAEVSKQ
jgi:uncharacterized membrane protein